MEAKDLRTMGVDELKARVRQWSDELFRSRIKAGSAEAKDTSIFKKQRKDIARANTVLNEKLRAGEKSTAKASTAPVVAAAEVSKSPLPVDGETKADKKPTTKKKSASTKAKE